MKRLITLIVVGSLTLIPLDVAAAKAPKFVVLGTDATNDAPPAVDLTSLAVARVGSNLEIRIGLANLLPVQGSFPKAGIEWTFDVGPRTFVAEGHPDVGGEFAFTLYEVKDGTFQTVGSIDGTLNATDGYLAMLVPLSQIGARKGTVISGTGETGTEDVDVHQHLEVTAHEVDAFATEKNYKIR